MTPLAFLREEASQRLLERAAKAAGVPLSLHFVEGEAEGPRILGWGGCAICRETAKMPGGRAVCRISRSGGSAAALRQQRPMPFQCHLGLACVAIPALPDEGFVLTFGPYCPAEGAPGLEFGVLSGLSSLSGAELETPPAPLDDIHRAPQGTVLAVAAWAAESLAELWTAASEESLPEPVAPVPPKTRARQRITPNPDPYAAQAIAAALAGGDQTQARNLLKSVLEEGVSGAHPRIPAQRARLLAAAAAALEAAERAGWGSDAAWEAWPELLERAAAATSQSELLQAGIRLLTHIKGEQKREKPPSRAIRLSYAALNAILAEHYAEKLTLEAVAGQLGEKPTTISHRLQRKSGMGFLEYLARYRVDKAKEYLRRNKQSATAIAGRVGFSDQSNFSKAFRRFTGMAPLEYRRRFGRKK